MWSRIRCPHELAGPCPTVLVRGKTSARFSEKFSRNFGNMGAEVYEHTKYLDNGRN
jgi:hypothetical protein